MQHRIVRIVVVLIASCASAWALRPRAIPTLAEATALDQTPAWNWQASQVLLTQPGGFCAPPLSAPGALVESHLLAWRTMTRTGGRGRQHEVLWWGHFRSATGEDRWVLTEGSASDGVFSPMAHMQIWSQRYTCDSLNEKHYIVFNRAPRAVDARRINGVLDRTNSDSSVNVIEHVIRRATWNVLMRDPPTIATSIIP